jgi:6,7-dimethyl-8-ribityllumazine synthase
MKKKLKVCIVRSMYNSTFELFQSANRELKKKNITASVIKVPGAFEIPVMIARNIKKYDGFIAIGCIIKGETPNFSLISNAIINGIMELSILHKKPIGNAIITCLNDEQAKKRTDKGKEAAKAVLEVLNGQSKSKQ